jgi:hypothetical protein
VKLRVVVRKITMNIKFPCSLALQLKYGSSFLSKIPQSNHASCMSSREGSAASARLLRLSWTSLTLLPSSVMKIRR